MASPPAQAARARNQVYCNGVSPLAYDALQSDLNPAGVLN